MDAAINAASVGLVLAATVSNFMGKVWCRCSTMLRTVDVVWVFRALSPTLGACRAGGTCAGEDLVTCTSLAGRRRPSCGLRFTVKVYFGLWRSLES